MRIVDAVYDDYAVVHTIKTKDGVSEVLNKLYSKSGSVTPQHLDVESVHSGSGESNPFFVLQVALLRPASPCSRSSFSSACRLASSPTTPSSYLRMVCH